MNVLASPRVPNSPLTPKSQSLTRPERVRRILEGLISIGGSFSSVNMVGRRTGQCTSVDDLATVEISQAAEDTFSNFTQDFLSNPASELLDFSVNGV